MSEEHKSVEDRWEGGPERGTSAGGVPVRPGLLRRLLGRPVLCFFLTLFLGLAISVGYCAWDAWNFLGRSAAQVAGAEAKDVIIAIEPGQTFDRVAWMLRKEGALASVWRFRLLAQYNKALGSVKAGEFQVSTGWTPERILTEIVSGRALLYRLTLREGLFCWEAAGAVEKAGFAKADDFKAVLTDPDFLRYYGIPFKNAEGFIFPETYLLRKPRAVLERRDAEDLAKLLVESFWKKTAQLWEQEAAKTAPAAGVQAVAGAGESTGAAGAAPAGGNGTVPAAPQSQAESVLATGAPDAAVRAEPIWKTEKTAVSPLVPAFARKNPDEVRRLVILASLVEKETAVPEERPKVAGLYANRLRIGMPLQCDPTIIYGLGPGFDGKIRRSNLDDAKNLYNTYQHAGLPPGPICSPGLSALKAAFKPEKHDYFYFVATGLPDGSHRFSRNLAEHNRAVREYRQAVGN